MAIRQTIRVRRTSTLYATLFLLIVGPLLAAIIFLVVTGRRQLAELQATTESQAAQMAEYERLLEASHWPLFFYESFDNAQHGWSIGEESSAVGTLGRSISESAYRWEVEASTNALWPAQAAMEPVSDFYATLTAHRVSGTENGRYGMIFRIDDKGNYYIFRIRDDQHFRLSLWHQQEWTTLIDWSYTSVIKPNKSNNLAVLANGAQFSLYINEQLVAQAIDNKVSEGGFGLAVELSSPHDRAIFNFENLEVRVP